MVFNQPLHLQRAAINAAMPGLIPAAPAYGTRRNMNAHVRNLLTPPPTHDHYWAFRAASFEMDDFSGNTNDRRGFFDNLSYCNHSCAPNANLSWKPNQDVMVLYAIQDIQKDDEITISYIDQLATDRVNRAAILAQTYRIARCVCEMCVRHIAASDNNRQRMRIWWTQPINVPNVPMFNFQRGEQLWSYLHLDHFESIAGNEQAMVLNELAEEYRDRSLQSLGAYTPSCPISLARDALRYVTKALHAIIIAYGHDSQYTVRQLHYNAQMKRNLRPVLT